MKSSNIFIILFLYLIFAGIMSCDKNDAIEEPTEPAVEEPIKPVDSIYIEFKNLDSGIIEVKEYPSTLFFVEKDPAGMPVGYPPGVNYMPESGEAWFMYEDSREICIYATICNFPDYAKEWNTNKSEGYVTDEYDVIITGIIHVKSQQTKETIFGTFELTSLKKRASEE